METYWLGDYGSMCKVFVDKSSHKMLIIAYSKNLPH